MKKTITLIIIALLISGCSKNQKLEDLSFELAQNLKAGNIELVKEQFYSSTYFDSFPNGNENLSMYRNVIKKIEIDKKEHITIDTITANLNHPILPKGEMQVFNCYVQMGVKMPSPVPEYFLLMQFIQDSGKYKLITLDLKTTKGTIENSTVEIEEEIGIEKDKIVEVSLMYEGGFKEPLVFKRNNISYEEKNIFTSKLDTLITLLNNSKIIKSQKEYDTRRFNGDPEMGIISLDLNNKFSWTIFKLITEKKIKRKISTGF